MRLIWPCTAVLEGVEGGCMPTDCAIKGRLKPSSFQHQQAKNSRPQIFFMRQRKNNSVKPVKTRRDPRGAPHRSAERPAGRPLPPGWLRSTRHHRYPGTSTMGTGIGHNCFKSAILEELPKDRDKTQVLSIHLVPPFPCCRIAA